MKRFLAFLLALIMVLSMGISVASAEQEVLVLDVYDDAANNHGMQTGWFAQVVKERFNIELNIIAPAMEDAAKHLNKGGRLAVISFHSLEDRIVKETMKYLSLDCICPPESIICTCDKERLIKVVVRKPIVAGAEELAENPRARSAKLRVGQRV